ncbi:hypothetical protein PSY31_22255, partial [Shigella flexneri]|nr:hypothetical protein [Shigella flexneri]
MSQIQSTGHSITQEVEFGDSMGLLSLPTNETASNPVIEFDVDSDNSNGSKKRKSNLRANVWNYYKRIKDPQGKGMKARCLACQKVLSGDTKS